MFLFLSSLMTGLALAEVGFIAKSETNVVKDNRPPEVCDQVEPLRLRDFPDLDFWLDTKTFIDEDPLDAFQWNEWTAPQDEIKKMCISCHLNGAVPISNVQELRELVSDFISDPSLDQVKGLLTPLLVIGFLVSRVCNAFVLSSQK